MCIDDVVMKIFIPLSDEQLEQLLSQEIPVPYQPGCVTLSQLSAPESGQKLSPDRAPADRPAARRVVLLAPR